MGGTHISDEARAALINVRDAWESGDGAMPDELTLLLMSGWIVPRGPDGDLYDWTDDGRAALAIAEAV